MTEPAPLAAGRSADVYAVADDRVLRRRRTGPIPDHEAVAMAAAHAHGFPVPRVYSVEGSDMIMERIDGDDLLAELSRRPWRARRVGRLLADLHRRLAAIPLDGVEIRTSFEPREALVHGDLHPGNVLASSAGPIVIDWEGASAGPSDADTVTTWLLVSIADPDDVPLVIRPFLAAVRRALIDAFLADLPAPRPATVRAVCDERLGDTNMRPRELERIRRFRAAHGSAD